MTLGKLPLHLIACALLCATVSGRALQPDNNVASEGKLSARGKRIASLAFHKLLSEASCKFHCNYVLSDGGPCEGVFEVSCLTSSSFTGVNITEIIKADCIGESSGYNVSSANDVSVLYSCDGVSEISSLSHIPLGEESLISMEHYGCSIHLALRSFQNSDVEEVIYKCKGTDLYLAASTVHSVEADSQDYLEQLLDEFAAVADPLTFDVAQYSNKDFGTFQSELQEEEITVTCNGEDSDIHTTCKGELQAELKTENYTETEECDGTWESLGETSFTCAGNYSFNFNEKAFGLKEKSVESCEGRIVYAYGNVKRRHHEFFEDGIACFGISSVTTETAHTEAAPSTKLDSMDIQLQ